MRCGIPIWKYIANRFITASENILFGAKISEYHTGYRAFPRELLEQLPLENNSDDFVFDNHWQATGNNSNMRSRHLKLIICLFLIVATLAVYWQVGNHEFVNFDDPEYVTENRFVQKGLTLESISWAFTATHASNWHPLTWLSHMLDCQLFGLNPGMHHLTNLLFHIASSILLFLIFRRMTGALWCSAFVAALFALHPLHVESVAWIAERKDVLSTFFWLLTMWAYARYAERPGLYRYLPVLLFFAMGIMAKPMLVTLPFVLLLLDYWPLGRFQLDQSGNDKNLDIPKSPVTRLILEKVPFFALAMVSSVVTFIVQQSGGAVKSLDAIPLNIRMANALVSYVGYIGKMIWPHPLAVLYPHPGMLPLWQVAGACLLLLSISLLTVRVVKKRPYLAVGWLWYLGTLVPVIGLVQVGSQSMADRYTYIPLIGLFIIIAWGVPDLVARWRQGKTGLVILAVSLLLVFMATTWIQVRYWKNSSMLFQHALNVTTNNYSAHNNLGIALAEQGDTPKAIEQYYEALRIKPDHATAHNNLGVALAKQGNMAKAKEHYSEALRINPGFAEAHINLGNALVKQDNTTKAIEHYYKALRINPGLAKAHYNLAIALEEQGNTTEAMEHYTKALRINPDYVEAHINWGVILKEQNKIDEAIKHYTKALRINPGFAKAHYNLAVALDEQGNLKEAMEHYSEAVRIKPDHAEAHFRLGFALLQQGSFEEAISHYSEVVRLDPHFSAVASYNIACIYAIQNKIEESIDSLKEAIKRGYKNWDFIKTDKDLNNIRSSSYYKELIAGH